MRAFGRHPSERSLSLLAGGDLGPARRWLVARHVRNCPLCRDAAADFRRGAAALRSSMPPPQADFAALAHRIRVEAAHLRPPPAAPAAWRWTAVAGAALAAFALAVTLTLPRSAPDAPTVAGSAAEAGLERFRTPLFSGGADTQVTAQGRLSVRAFHRGSGTLTVTEYYAP